MILKTMIGYALFISFLATPKFAASDPVYDLSTENLAARALIEDGWGDRNNLYAWTMESFKGKLYVGTLNVKGGALGMNLFLWNFPPFTNGAEVHEGTRDSDGNWEWRRVLTDGLRCKHNYGIRKLIATGDFMYGVTGNHAQGFDIFKTGDGETWETVMQGGFGNKNNNSGRGMIVFGDYLYIGTANWSEGAEIWRHLLLSDGDLDPESDWEKVVSGGNGDELNTWYGDMVEFNGYIYSGTLNEQNTGAELHRSPDGENWEVVVSGGAGIPTDRAFMKLYVFNDRLYMGTMNFKEGASLLVSTDANATDFEHIYTKGYDNSANAYTWYMLEFGGRLYVSTFNTFGQEEFDLFSSEDPTNGEPLLVETRDGFANNVYGVRSMLIHDGYLIFGGASNNKPAHVWECTNVTTT